MFTPSPHCHSYQISSFSSHHHSYVFLKCWINIPSHQLNLVCNETEFSWQHQPATFSLILPFNVILFSSLLLPTLYSFVLLFQRNYSVFLLSCSLPRPISELYFFPIRLFTWLHNFPIDPCFIRSKP